MSEQQFQPDWFSKPGDTIAALMAERHLSRANLAIHLNVGVDFVRGLLSGLIAVDSDIAKGLSNCFGGSSAFWLKRQSLYEQALDRIAESVSKSAASDWMDILSESPMRKQARTIGAMNCFSIV